MLLPNGWPLLLFAAGPTTTTTRIGTGRSEVGRHLNRGIISFRISHHPYTILCKTRQSDILYLTGDELPEGDAYPAVRLEIFFSFHSGCSSWERWAQRNLIVVVGKWPRRRGSRFHSTYSGWIFRPSCRPRFTPLIFSSFDPRAAMCRSYGSFAPFRPTKFTFRLRVRAAARVRSDSR